MTESELQYIVLEYLSRKGDKSVSINHILEGWEGNLSDLFNILSRMDKKTIQVNGHAKLGIKGAVLNDTTVTAKIIPAGRERLVSLATELLVKTNFKPSSNLNLPQRIARKLKRSPSLKKRYLGLSDRWQIELFRIAYGGVGAAIGFIWGRFF